jgi:hypothetical protein
MSNNKITPEHLARSAIVYIRQSRSGDSIGGTPQIIIDHLNVGPPKLALLNECVLTPLALKIAHHLTYAFGQRSRSVRIANGRKRIINRRRRNWNEWDV